MAKENQKITPREIRKLIVFGILFATAVYLAIKFIVTIVGVVVLFSLVALIVIVLNPLVGWLERRRIPRPLSAGVLALAALGLVGLLAWLAIPIAVREARDLISHAPQYASSVSRFLASKGLAASDAPVRAEQISDIAFSKAGAVLSRIGAYTMSIAGLVASGLIVFISVIYALSSPRPLAEGLLRMLPPDGRGHFTDVMQQVSVQMRQWALSMIAGMAAIFVLTWILLGPILHVQFAFVFALLAGLLEIVPTIGPVASAVLPVLVALAQDPLKAVWVVVGFIIIQQVESHLIIPLILGRGVRLHPLTVVFSVVVMALLFGIIGIFLAVPVAAVTKTLVEEFYLKPREAGEKDLSEHVEQIVSGQTEEEPEA